jgi:hypothetical protein
VIDALRTRGVAYRFVSNGWHIGRVVPHMKAHAPEFVRLSLSGGDEAVHDEERGRGSFRRVLLATAMLTSERIPTSWSLLVDRRSRHQIADTAALAEALGCMDLHVILPQPTPTSAARGSDIDPAEWLGVRHEVEALNAVPGRKTAIVLDYGAPYDGPEQMCNTMQLKRIYVDAHGRLSTCCQLSDYGSNETDVVADLNTVSLHDVFDAYNRKMNAQILATRVTTPRAAADGLAPYPCMRCAQATGKLAWLADYPDSPWYVIARAGLLPSAIVQLAPSRPQPVLSPTH